MCEVSDFGWLRQACRVKPELGKNKAREVLNHILDKKDTLLEMLKSYPLIMRTSYFGHVFLREDKFNEFIDVLDDEATWMDKYGQ